MRRSKCSRLKTKSARDQGSGRGMLQRKTERNQKIKTLRATVIVLSLFLAVFLFEPLFDRGMPYVNAAIEGQVVLQEMSTINEAGEGYEMYAQMELPTSFAEELFYDPTFYLTQVSEGSSVIGFLSQDDPEAVFGRCVDVLSKKGWSKVDSTQRNTATFMKSGGKFTWAFISCTSISQDTSIVVQVA